MTARLTVPAAGLADLAAIRTFICDAAAEVDLPPEAVDDLVCAVDEAATNVIRHGYDGAPGPIEVEVTREGSTLVVRLRDAAPLFDPTTYPSPDLELGLDERRPGGFGIHLTRTSVDRVEHRPGAPAGNELTLVKSMAAVGRTPG
jgi:serine/threonine-protein kinase RsbW